MLDRLYVVTEMPDLAAVANAIRRRETVHVFIQKYVAVNGSPFKRAWVEPAQCTLKPSDFGND